MREGGVATGKLLDTQPLFGESTTDVGLGFRYRTKLAWPRKTGVTFQLNISNLLDETDPMVRRAARSIIAPGATPPTVATSIASSYFLRNPRAWTFSPSSISKARLPAHGALTVRPPQGRRIRVPLLRSSFLPLPHAHSSSLAPLAGPRRLLGS